MATSEQSPLEVSMVACTHYQRAASIAFKCCGNPYPCRHCHDLDDACDKTANCPEARATATFTCNVCCLSQAPVEKCMGCGNSFGNYFCRRCSFVAFTNEAMYHCDKCRICIKGDPSKYKHCDRCGVCMSNAHVCKGRNLREDQCFCDGSPVLDSALPTAVLCCGHVLHERCLSSLRQANSQPRCPFCRAEIW
jgi:RING finger and CHY zinc finger domain-containing protein 1